MKRYLVLSATLALAALVAMSGCASAARAPQPTAKAAAPAPAEPTKAAAPAAQPTAAPAAAAQPTAAAAAQPAVKFPTKGIQIFVGFDPGSGSDVTVRAFAPFLQKALGQPVTVINQGGAGGALSWANIAKGPTDGYTIGYVAMPSMQNAAVTSKVEYDPLNSFSWLGSVAYDPVALGVKPDGPFKTLNDFVDAAKKNSGKVSIGATGKASIDYTIGLSIEKSKGVKFNIVNFDGGAAGITAVMGGNLDAMGLNASTILPYDKGGQLRTLGVGGESRFATLPNVPTFKEQGVDLYVHGVYRGLLGAKGIPADVQSAIVKAIKTASDDPEWKAAADKISLPLMYLAPDQHGALAKQLNDAAKVYLAQ